MSTTTTEYPNREVAREARLAEAKARRSTPEFVEAGAALVAAREAEAAEAAARHLAEAAAREDAYWTGEMLRLPSRRIAGLADDLDDLVAEHDEGAASDVVDGFILSTVLVGSPSRAKIATALELWRTSLGLSVAEGLDRIRRIG